VSSLHLLRGTFEAAATQRRSFVAER